MEVSGAAGCRRGQREGLLLLSRLTPEDTKETLGPALVTGREVGQQPIFVNTCATEGTLVFLQLIIRDGLGLRGRSIRHRNGSHV